MNTPRDNGRAFRPGIDRRCLRLRCQNPRQDLQCQLRDLHDGPHLTTLPLGYCDPRYSHLTDNGAGHRTPRLTD
jgi:hypothetical protein